MPFAEVFRRTNGKWMFSRLPGSSRQFGPPRHVVDELRTALPREENVAKLLLENNTDSWAYIGRSEEQFFPPAKTVCRGQHSLPQDSSRFRRSRQALFSLNRARVVGYEGLVFTENDSIFGEAYPWSLPEHASRAMAETILPRSRSMLHGTYIHATCRSHRNYFHWMFDVVARIVELTQYVEFRKLPLLVPADITDLQREILSKLAFEGSVMLQPSNDVLVEKLLFASYVQDTKPHAMAYTPPKRALCAMRKSFLREGPRLNAGRRVFISRSDARSRLVVNEAAILESLMPFGFERVILSGMPFDDQVRLFESAECVVGPHGAGFVNLIFCSPGTRVLELFTPSFIHRAYYCLTSTMGLQYYYLVGESVGEDMVVSPKDVIEALQNIGIG